MVCCATLCIFEVFATERKKKHKYRQSGKNTTIYTWAKNVKKIL